MTSSRASDIERLQRERARDIAAGVPADVWDKTFIGAQLRLLEAVEELCKPIRLSLGRIRCRLLRSRG